MSYISDLSTDKTLLLLSQAYANQLTTSISVMTKKEIKTFTGTIPSISKEQILLKATTSHENIMISDIISIKPVREVIHEST